MVVYNFEDDLDEDPRRAPRNGNDFEDDLADEDPPRAPRNGTGYLFSMTMAVVLIIVALALLKAVAGPTSHDARRGSATVEAVLTPTPHSEPIPATDPRPREEPI